MLRGERGGGDGEGDEDEDGMDAAAGAAALTLVDARLTMPTAETGAGRLMKLSACLDKRRYIKRPCRRDESRVGAKVARGHAALSIVEPRQLSVQRSLGTFTQAQIIQHTVMFVLPFTTLFAAAWTVDCELCRSCISPG